MPSDSNHVCSDLAALAERELAAFFQAVAQLFGSEQAKLSVEDWLQEAIEVDPLPTSVREWRSITAKVSIRLANRLNTFSHSTEPQFA